MNVRERIKNGVAVVSLKGDLLDDEDISLFRQKIQSLATDDIKRVVVDLSLVNRINSEGLSTLISAVQNLRRTGGDLRLAHIDKNLQSILTITKLVHFFGTYETVERAMASYRN